MQPLTRQLSLALLLLAAFLAVAVAGQAWLEREARRAQADTIAAKRAQLLEALTLSRRTPETVDPELQRALGDLLGGTVIFFRGAAPPAAITPAPGQLTFDEQFPGAADLTARVVFALPAAGRLAVLHQRMLVVLVLLGLTLGLIMILLTLPRRSGADGGSRAPWLTARHEMRDLEHFARISVERSEALARESGARLRAEEDLQLSRTLLGQSQDARIRLGRELHDNLCQTLYGVSLTLEGLRAKLAPDATGAAEQRVDQCVAELRRLNHEFRTYLKELEPTAVQRQPFTEALDVMLAAQACAADTRLVRNIDEEATALIPPARANEVVNVLREAISNSVRHGRPRTITIHAQRGEGCVVLAVQDDGAGFAPGAAPGAGHGLANMQARAEALGGSMRIVSAPGKGTRVLLNLPVPAAA